MTAGLRQPFIFMDWFCCAGGGGLGYWRALQGAGIRIIGVDKDYQPNYPFAFFQGDALEAMDVIIGGGYWNGIGLEDIVANHGSPPCQLFCMYRNVKSVRESTDANYLNLIPDTRERFQAMGKPWIMENVVPRGWKTSPPADFLDPAATIQLCGTSFGIPVRRHRLFELGGWKVEEVPPCAHHRFTERRFPGSTNRPNGRTVCNIGEWRVPVPVQKECMTLGVDSPFTLEEISEMIPPPMTEFLGLELLKHLEAA